MLGILIKSCLSRKLSFYIPQQPDSVYINESGLYTLLKVSKTILRRKNIDTTDEEINKLSNKNKILSDLKLEKFPDGGMDYVVEIFDTDEIKYDKIGETDNMNKKIKSHSFFK